MNPAEQIPPAIRQEAEAVVRATAEACRRELALVRHELPLRRSWRFDVRLSWSPHRTASRGGVEGISLAMLRHTPNGPWGFCWYPEYSRIDPDPCLGGVASPDWRHAIQAVTAHEVAHVAQHRIAAMPVSRRGRMRKFDLRTGHGSGWRGLYGILRAAIVNPNVKAAGGWIGGLKDQDRAAVTWALPSLGDIESRTGLRLRPVDQMVRDGRARWSIRHLAFGELRRPVRVSGKRRGSWARLCDGAPEFRLSDPDWPIDRSVTTLATCPQCLLAIHEARARTPCTATGSNSG